MSRIVVGIVVEQSHVLLVKRRQREGDLMWAFPGGGVQDDEREDEAVQRELLEELGLRVQPVKRLGAREHPSTGAHVAYWLCTRLRADEATTATTLQVLDLDELEEARWVLAREVPSLITSDIFTPVRDALEHMEGGTV